MLTEKDLTSIEDRLGSAHSRWELNYASIAPLLKADFLRLLADYRLLLPLADALASGEADQYKEGWNAALQEVVNLIADRQRKYGRGVSAHDTLLAMREAVSTKVMRS